MCVRLLALPTKAYPMPSQAETAIFLPASHAGWRKAVPVGRRWADAGFHSQRQRRSSRAAPAGFLCTLLLYPPLRRNVPPVPPVFCAGKTPWPAL